MWTKPATKVRVRTSAPIHNQSNLELFSCGDWGIVALYFSIQSGNCCSAMVVLLTADNSPLLAVGFVFALEQTAAQNLTLLGACAERQCFRLGLLGDGLVTGTRMLAPTLHDSD